MMTEKITTTWKGELAFESTNPSGKNLPMDASPEVGGNNEGYRPKALLLSGLAGCSGIDVAALIKKMRLEVTDFKIEIDAHMTDTHPKYYDQVAMNFYFYGQKLDKTKLQKAVDLSIERYCGVMEMFRQFATVEVHTHFNV